MSNWDLMMPGMGLTAIGLAGLTISYAGLAHTFIDGMHALTGLTMFVGLIFLATGILDGGVSTSNRAKATTLVILSISLGFGMYAFTLNTSAYTATIAGILVAIAFPSILIAYLAMKHPKFLKPIGSIVGIAGATGVIMWVAFGLVGPDQYLIPQEVEVAEPEAAEVAAPPAVSIEILAGSAIQGSPDYDPDSASAVQGDIIEWTNADDVVHTVTSLADIGETFDSSLIDAGGTFQLDTSGMEPGEYEYFCTVHAWMVATLDITEPAKPVTVTIPDGAAVISDGQVYYDPENIEVDAGTTVQWENQDTLPHTATSGTPDSGADGAFDSDALLAGDSFSFTFSEPGTYEYYCTYHPWMVGTVTVR